MQQHTVLQTHEVFQFRQDGFLIHDLLDPREIGFVRDALDSLEHSGARDDPALTFRDQYLFEIHDLPRRPGVLSRLVQHHILLKMVEELLASNVDISAGLMLDKPASNNWEIGWHQDTSVYSTEIPLGATGERRGGLPTFRPLDDTMSKCVVARIAIDNASIEHGNLFVIPGTQHENLWPHGGKRYSGQIGIGLSQSPGSVLFYTPLLMHRAEPNRHPGTRRRVLQLFYRPSNLKLPSGEWYPWPQPSPLVPLDNVWHGS